ncbi:MAG: hypothetical protein QOK15_2732 [Nocardioidaceae bacterium]|nr:hypothetical protein [Nocardioidaceae bacterium]
MSTPDPQTAAPATTPAPGRTATPGPTTESTGRDRLWAALRTGSRGQAVAGVLLAVLGCAAVVQVRANGRDDNFVGARQSDLIALINTLTVATDRAQSDIASLQRTRDSLRDNAAARETALGVARRQAETLGILAGTLPAVGPGIRVTISSPTGSIGTDQLLNGLEELRSAGAEAIQINGKVRVVAQTGIADGQDNGLLVDGVALQPPYVIDAIGDPGTLATAMAFSGGLVDEVDQVGGTARVQKLDDQQIATTSKVTPPRFAQPAQQE